MKRYFLFSGFILFFAINLHGQPFVPGTIVSNEGEITHGYIRNVGPLQRCSFVEFKPSEAENAKKYYPGEISAYQIRELQYQSIAVVFLGEDQERKVFARKLVDGEPSLFRLDYEVRDDAGGPIYDFTTVFYIARLSSDQSVQILQEGNYMGLLKAWLGECDITEQQSRIDRYNFQDADLSRLIADYNACRGETASILASAPKAKGEFLVGGSFGYLIPTISPTHPLYAPLDRTTSSGFEFQLSATGYFWDFLGLQMSAGYSRRIQNWSATYQVDPQYSYSAEEYTLKGQSELNNITMGLDVMLRPWPKSTFQPYLFGGFVFGYGLKSENFAQQGSFYSSTTDLYWVIEDSYPYSRLNDPGNDVGARFGIGMNWQVSDKHLIHVEFFNHRSRNDLPKSSRYSILANTYGIKLGYLFR